VTHPFHPLFGREFEFVKRRRDWSADHVYVRDDAGELRPLPVAWTDLAAADPFVVAAVGRSPLRTDDLLELVELVERLTARRRAAGSRGVQRTMP
jgi:hypothetical protein